MQHTISLKSLLSQMDDPDKQNAAFAMLGLGVTESLASGMLSASEALHTFFHADNCLFVHRFLSSKLADAFMSHGVQLADLFYVLPLDEAQREYQRELAAMRAHCLRLLEQERILV